MARASTKTLLSLDRFSQIMGIDPFHFNGAAGSQIYPTFTNCGDIYPQYAWQVPDSLVSREEIALAIFSAEQDIKRILGYSPALAWEVAEPGHYPSRRSSNTPPYKLRFGHVVGGGKRAVTLVGNYPLVYQDLDGDGFKEVAAITVPNIAVCDADGVPYHRREIKVYFAGKNGAQEWEIRYPREFTVAGGFVTIRLDAWLLLKPALTHMPSTAAGFGAVNIEESTSFVTTVDVYREWNNPDGAVEVNEPGCEWDVHAGCLSIGNRELGLVSPSLTEGSACIASEMPMDIRSWYLAGEQSDEYEMDMSSDSLSDYWAQTIAWMATARLEKDICSCSNVREVAEALRRNVAANSSLAGGNAYNSIDTIANPFGTRVGEVRGWNRAMNMANEQIMNSGAF